MPTSIRYLCVVLIALSTEATSVSSAFGQTILNTTTTYDGIPSAIPAGSLTIDGPDTPSLNLINGATLLSGINDLLVGYTQSGALNVQGGSRATSNLGILGYAPTGNGTATIDGMNSQWTLSVNLIVGNSGTGTLNVQNSGRVYSNNALFGSGYTTGDGTVVRGVGVATVSGASSVWSVTNGLTVGEIGTGTLNIQGGGRMDSRYGVLGSRSSGIGIATISGANSVWSMTGQLADGRSGVLLVGSAGSGELNIQDGGRVNSYYALLGSDFTSSSETTGVGTATVSGANAVWSVTEQIIVGGDGTGTLNIQSGGRLESRSGILGQRSTGVGTATVSGENSVWSMTNDLYVGYGGTGTLNIQDGGRVNSLSGVIGVDSMGIGTVTISGENSVWNLTGGLYVGYSDGGTLNMQDGGALFVGDTLKLWDAGTLTIDGGSVTARSLDKSVGTLHFNDGTLTVSGGTYTHATGSGTAANILTLNGNTPTDVPMLRLTNGATVVGAEATVIGSTGGGSLEISGGSILSNTGSNMILGTVDGKSVRRGFGFVGFGNGSHGTATVIGAGSQWNLAANLHVGGTEPAATGTLNVLDGGRVQSSGGNLGAFYTGYGEATIAGVGSQWITSTDQLSVGYFGSGKLDVYDGGLVEATWGYVGRADSGAGTATITGVDSLWRLTGNLFVGVNGTGSLNVLDGGGVTSNYAFLASSFGANGAAWVSGEDSRWTVTNSLFVGGSAISPGGTASVIVANGGTLGVGTTLKLWGSGKLTIDGGSVTTRSLDKSVGTLELNDGTVTISGGTYTHATGTGTAANIFILNGNTPTAVPTVRLTNGATTVGVEATVIGSTGRGELFISGGSVLSSTGSSITLGNVSGRSIFRGDGDIGLAAGSTGTATITGAGSRWILTNALNIGCSGVGTLAVENGGRVQSVYAIVGEKIMGNGTATITDASSLWSTDYLTVGNNGTGTLNVQNSGRVATGLVALGNEFTGQGTVTVSGANSQLSAWNRLYIALNGTGVLNVQNGGRVTVGYGYLGFQPSGSGSATVNGSNSEWYLSESLEVGSGGIGILNVQDGGTVISSTGVLASVGGSTGTATITGDGSHWNVANNLYIGGSQSASGGTGNLTITGGGRAGVGGLTKIYSGHGVVTIGPGGTLATGSLDGNVTNNGSLVIGGVNASSTYNGVISGLGEVHKVGSGLVTFGGSNTYSGGTYVDAGTLVFNSAVPSGEVHVADGATLRSSSGSLYINDLFVNNGAVSGTTELQNGAFGKGSGTFEHLVVNNGATFSPGNSPGTITDTTTTWNGGTYLWEINTLAGDGGLAGQNPGWDLWNTGLLSVNGSFVISVNSLTTGNVAGALANWNPNLEQDWLIATASNGAFSSLGFLSLDTSPFAAYNALGGGVFSLLSGGGGNELHLHYAAVPEPSSLILGGVLAVGFYRRYRRGRNTSDTQARTVG
jgi:fibronectin-binding autotransporter adhesin